MADATPILKLIIRPAWYHNEPKRSEFQQFWIAMDKGTHLVALYQADTEAQARELIADPKRLRLLMACELEDEQRRTRLIREVDNVERQLSAQRDAVALTRTPPKVLSKTEEYLYGKPNPTGQADEDEPDREHKDEYGMR